MELAEGYLWKMNGNGKMYADAFGRALDTDHAEMALRAGTVRKYPRDVAPFASLEALTLENLRLLRGLMELNESVWLVTGAVEPPLCPGLAFDDELPCLQMAYPVDVAVPLLHGDNFLVPLSCRDRAAMVSLTEIAFPGFFREWTCRMGRYFGVWEGGVLVAMGGERINFTVAGKRYREISGLCTHPEHRGKGYGSALLAYLLRLHRSEGSTSWLHVSTKNPARELYKKLGFVTENVVELRKVRKAGSVLPRSSR